MRARKLFNLLGAIAILTSYWGNCTAANSQIVPDSTLGNENSQITPETDIKGIVSDLIEGGARRGDNLFHSFRQFSIEAGKGAYFANPEGILNIFSRVTGNNASEIMGRLGVLGNADLFLINPNGIIFGENASLDVSGSFVGTTASGIQFGDRGLFDATDPEAPPLLTVQPSAFFFNQIDSGAIATSSIAPTTSVDILGRPLSGLIVPNGESLLLVGGEIAIDGGELNALDGRIELVSVADTKEIELNTSEDNLSLRLPDQLQSADISIRNSAFVNTSNAGGGEIYLQGKNISISGQSLVFADILGDLDGKGIAVKAENLTIDRSAISIDILGTGNGGSINIDAIELNIDNQGFIFARNFGMGNGGNIAIAVENLTLANGSQISSSNFGRGNSGDISINATESISLDLSNIESEIAFDALGDGGNISLTARNLALANLSEISTTTFGQGDGGNISIDASSFSVSQSAALNSNVGGIFGRQAGNIAIAADNIILDGGILRSRLDAGAEGNGGDINITTDSLLVTGIPPEIADSNTGQLVTATFGKGNAGSLTIDATGEVIFDGRGSDVFSLIGGNIGSPNISPAEGNAGNITIDSNSLVVRNQARLVSNTEGTGDAGNIKITANSLQITDFGALSAGADGIGVGDAGNIDLNVRSLNISQGGRINASTSGSGNAGNINVRASDRILLSGINEENTDSVSQSTVTTQVAQGANGEGGDIKFEARSITLEDGFIISSVSQSMGGGGSINLDASQIKIDNGLINASTLGEGTGGSIKIASDRFLEVNGSELSLLQENILVSALQNPDVIREIVAQPENANAGLVQGIFAFTSGSGEAGKIEIDAENFILSDGALISTASLGAGEAGKTSINVERLFDLDGGIVATSTLAVGDAGNIELNVNKLLVHNGGQVVATTLNTGNGGDLTVNASESIELIGNGNPSNFFNPGLLVGSQSPTAIGNGGNLKLTAPKLEISNGAAITAVARGRGNAGNIELMGLETLLLRDRGFISTTAGIAGTGGNGGNIDIDTDFLIAFPAENTDIVANAFQGKGGNINIRARRIFGIDEGRAIPGNSTNDIDASSELGLSGNIKIDVTDVELGNENIKLTTRIQKTEVAGVCEPGNFLADDRFFISDRGGLPDSPTAALEGNLGWEDWQVGGFDVTNSSDSEISKDLLLAERAPVLEARHWLVNNRGKIQLVADAKQNTKRNFWQQAYYCQPRVATDE